MRQSLTRPRDGRSHFMLIRGRWTQGVVLAAAIAIGLASTSAVTARTSAASKGGIATFAMTAGFKPVWIFPVVNAPNDFYTSVNDFLNQMYPPLYAIGKNGQDTFNPGQSLAYPPVYSNGGRTVTIRLKPYTWSDGHPLTSRDVRFFLNLITANKAVWANYAPGLIPDSIVRTNWTSSRTFQLTFSHAFSHLWLLYNQLSEIIPLPQFLWDRTSSSSPVGNYDFTTKGAVAVYKYLAAQSADTAAYGSNPLWQVVDGPWVLKDYVAATGESTFVPNPRYSGSVHPKLSEFRILTFTTATAEYNALRGGEVDYGYLPIEDVSLAPSLKRVGYAVVPWQWLAINYMKVDYTSPPTKQIMDKLYIRQAIAHLINQPLYIRAIFHGYATPDYGPVPQSAGNLADQFERHDPYPYSIQTAINLLRVHGWSIHPNGTDTCTHAGTAAADCGAGIKVGQPLSLRFLYGNTTEQVVQMAEAIQSAASKAGITLNPQPHNDTELYALEGRCPMAPPCNWDLLTFSGSAMWNFSSPTNLPTGEGLFNTGALYAGGYSDPHTDALINQTHLVTSLGAMYAYENYLAVHLPVIFLPVPVLQISVISKHLHGALPQSVLQEINPATWYLTK